MTIFEQVKLLLNIVSLLLGLYHINKAIRTKKDGDRIEAIYDIGFAIVFLTLAFN